MNKEYIGTVSFRSASHWLVVLLSILLYVLLYVLGAPALLIASFLLSLLFSSLLVLPSVAV